MLLTEKLLCWMLSVLSGGITPVPRTHFGQVLSKLNPYRNVSLQTCLEFQSSSYIYPIFIVKQHLLRIFTTFRSIGFLWSRSLILTFQADLACHFQRKCFFSGKYQFLEKHRFSQEFISFTRKGNLEKLLQSKRDTSIANSLVVKILPWQVEETTSCSVLP